MTSLRGAAEREASAAWERVRKVGEVVSLERVGDMGWVWKGIRTVEVCIGVVQWKMVGRIDKVG